MPTDRAAATGSSRSESSSRPAILMASMVDCLYLWEKCAGIVTTHFLLVLLSSMKSSADFFNYIKTEDEITSGRTGLVLPLASSRLNTGLPLLSWVTSNGQYFFISSYYSLYFWSFVSYPMIRFASYSTFPGVDMADWSADSPTFMLGPLKATTEGVVLFPW